MLQEFYAVTTRKFRPALPRARARELVAAYAEWTVVQVDPPLVIEASVLEERHQLAFWDALILAAARRAGVTRLVSEDFQTGRRLAGVRIENPFA